MQQGTTSTSILALERLQGRVRRRVLRRGLLGWAAVAAPAATVAVWASGAESMRAGFIAAGLSFGLLAILAAAAVRLVWRPWRRHADRGAFAATVEARFPLGNIVVAAEESARKPERWPDGDAVARELARRLDAGAQSALASLTPAHIDPDRHSTRRLVVLAAGMAAGIALITFQPATTVRGLLMLARPFGSAGTHPATALVAEPSAPWVVAGGSITLAAIDYAAESSLAHAEVRFGDAAWSKLAAEPVKMAATAFADPAVAVGGGTPGTPRRRWSITLDDVREDFSWRFRRGDTSTSVGRVVVRHPPLLAGLSARITPPAYMGLPAMNVDRLPALSEVPAGSRVSLMGRAGGGRTDGGATDGYLAAAWLQTAVGDSLPMAVDGSVVTIDLSVTREVSFTVGLRDRYGLTSHGPLGYRLAVLADQRPAVTLVRPQDDGLLPLDGRVSLLVEATDDFGLKRLDLLAKAGGSAPEDAALTDRAVFGPRASGQWQTLRTAAGDMRWRARELEPGGAPLRAALALEIEAGDLELVPGDVLALAVEARDNHAPGEGQTTRSNVLRLALPSAADVLAEQAESAEQGRQELEEAKRRGRQLDADLERLARELMKNPVPDWARQQEIEAALERQQALQRELARVAEELRRQMEQLAGGKLTSEAQLERAEQLAQLLAPPEAGKLAELLAKLEQPGGQVAPDQVARAMDEVAQAQKDLERRLDAALATMKRMADEQRFEGLTSLLEDMMRRQQELAELSRNLEDQKAEKPDGDSSKGEQGDPSPSAEELARRQEALAKELEQLREKLEEALAEQRASAGDPKDEQGDTGEQGEQGESGEKSENSEMSPQEQALREALEKLKQQQSSGSMGKASEMLQKMDPSQAAQMQQQALRDLGSLYSVLLASQQAMQAAMKMEQMSSLRGLAADLLALSARQEELGARIPVQLQDVRNVELTRQQHRLQKAAIGTRDRLSGLLEEAPNRILKLLEKMDDLIELMGGGVRALDEGRAAAARDQSGRSLAESNRIVIGLLTEAQMAGGGGGGGGQQQSASEQLQELARRQAELNGATEELRRMLADRGISQQMRSQMQRLGQQQGALGQELAKLTERERERPAGEGARLLGDMEELGSQMERVGDDLGAGQVDQEVLLRQDRILGRLLDARNSVRERDYSSRRESRSAVRPFDPQTGSDGRSGTAGDASALQRYQRLEDAPLEYRELVRRYFAAIDSLQRAMPGTREGILP